MISDNDVNYLRYYGDGVNDGVYVRYACICMRNLLYLGKHHKKLKRISKAHHSAMRYILQKASNIRMRRLISSVVDHKLSLRRLVMLDYKAKETRAITCLFPTTKINTSYCIACYNEKLQTFICFNHCLSSVKKMEHCMFLRVVAKGPLVRNLWCTIGHVRLRLRERKLD